MLDLIKINLNTRLPLLLINADPGHVRDFCRQQLGTDARSQALWAAASHPDFLELSPELEAVRALNEFVHSRPQIAAFKIILIPHAEQLNAYAANALLKNLEEPGTDTVFILMAPHAKLLLPTIISRCQVLNCQHTTSSADALSTQQDNIAQILSDLQSLWVARTIMPLQIAEQWQKQWADQTLYWLELGMAALIKRCYLGQQQLPLPMSQLWATFDQVKTANVWLGKQMQPNKQLLLEAILVGN